MARDIRVSVIVPVYNVERYVEKAVRSMLNQTLKEIEILIVDDGSTDRSGEIVENLAREDDRVFIVHRENGGVASARNQALSRSRGKYLYFMDPDDWAEQKILEAMANYADAHALELTICGFYIHTYYDSENFVTSTHTYPDTIYPTQRDFRRQAHALFDINLLYPPWNKLYLTEYVRARDIQFPDTFWDDFPFNLDVLRDVARVGVLAEPYYHFYRARGESENSKYRTNMYEKREEEHRWMIELYQYWGTWDEHSAEMVSRRYLERLVGCVENIACEDCALPYAEKIGKVRSMIKSDAAREALRKAKPRSIYMRALLLPIRWRTARLAYLEGRFISRIKRRNARLFAVLKANR